LTTVHYVALFKLSTMSRFCCSIL